MNMKLITMVGMSMYILIFMLLVMVVFGVANIIKAYKERNQLRVEVAAMHDRSNRVSTAYMSNREELERRLAEARAQAKNARWEKDIMVESYQADIQKLKKQLAMKDKLLKQADETIARERALRTAEPERA